MSYNKLRQKVTNPTPISSDSRHPSILDDSHSVQAPALALVLDLCVPRDTQYKCAEVGYGKVTKLKVDRVALNSWPGPGPLPRQTGCVKPPTATQGCSPSLQSTFQSVRRWCGLQTDCTVASFLAHGPGGAGEFWVHTCQRTDLLSFSVSVPAAGHVGVLREEPHQTLHG